MIKDDFSFSVLVERWWLAIDSHDMSWLKYPSKVGCVVVKLMTNFGIWCDFIGICWMGFQIFEIPPEFLV